MAGSNASMQTTAWQVIGRSSGWTPAMQRLENVKSGENHFSPSCFKHAKLIIKLSKSANMTQRSIYTMSYAVEDHAMPNQTNNLYACVCDHTIANDKVYIIKYCL